VKSSDQWAADRRLKVEAEERAAARLERERKKYRRYEYVDETSVERQLLRSYRATLHRALARRFSA
jgi:hypothetical protein